MGIVVTVRLWYILTCSEFYVVETLELSFVYRVDFSTFTPHCYLCHFILSSGVKKTNKYKEVTHSFDQLIIPSIQIYQIMLAVNIFIFFKATF